MTALTYTTLAPICPECGSARVVPDPDSAGRNACRACGHRAPVVKFHEHPVKPWQPVPARATHQRKPHFWWQEDDDDDL